jgi:hypothetical protein
MTRAEQDIYCRVLSLLVHMAGCEGYSCPCFVESKAIEDTVAARNGRPAAGEIREAVPDNPGEDK